MTVSDSSHDLSAIYMLTPLFLLALLLSLLFERRLRMLCRMLEGEWGVDASVGGDTLGLALTSP